MLTAKQCTWVGCLFLIGLTGCSRRITETGLASFYGTNDGYHGKKTANGEVFDRNRLTAAHKTIAFGTVVTVTNLTNGQKIKVRINDRGPFVKGRIIDLSSKAAKKIDMTQKGVAQVRLSYKKKKTPKKHK